MEANTYAAITLGWGFVLIFAGILFSALTTSRKLDRMLHIFCDGVIVILLISLIPLILLASNPSTEIETIPVTSIKETNIHKSIASVTYLDTNGEETTVGSVKDIYYGPDYETHLQKQTEKFWFLYHCRYTLYLKEQ